MATEAKEGRKPHTVRINHPALVAANVEETKAFYQNVLNMDLVLEQPNMDDPSSVHLFFDVGNDCFLAFFAPADPGRTLTQRGVVGVGSMQHIAFDVDPEDFEAFRERLEEAGVRYSGPVDRGYERSIYFRDPNGIILELLTWITPPPEELPQAAVIKKAQEIRRARGATFIEDEDVRAAIAALKAGPPP
jgi:catechol 2,3-dioxygenase-like lactoylglutathione lyase family enzyme